MNPHCNSPDEPETRSEEKGAAAEIARLRVELATSQLEVTRHQGAERVARAQTLALARALELLTTQPELDTFLSQVLGVMGEHLNVHAVALWLFDAQNDTLHFDRVYEKQPGETSGRVFSGAGIGHDSALLPVASHLLPVWAEMNRTRAPVVVSDVANDPRMELYRGELAARCIETVLHVPLLLPGGAIGYLGAGTRRRQYSDEQLAVTQAMAHQMTVAIQLARLANKGRSDAQNAAVLGERGRIARDIHDTLAQSLTAALFQVEAARSIAQFPNRKPRCVT